MKKTSGVERAILLEARAYCEAAGDSYSQSRNDYDQVTATVYYDVWRFLNRRIQLLRARRAQRGKKGARKR